MPTRPKEPRPNRATALALLAVLALALPTAAAAQRERAPARPQDRNRELVNLDFDDVELTVVIDTIAKLTGKNFIYDDRVRGRVTILSPEPVTVDQAYAVFESVLKVKGFTAVSGPANVLKIIPVRDAKEANIETVGDDRASANRDNFVTRLIPLLYIDATEITTTIKPLVSKDASIIAYAATNMIILTDTESNIRRLLTILEAIDVTTHKEELAVIKVKHADAATIGQQISEIYGAEVQTSGTRTTSRSTSASRRTTSRTSTTAPSASGTRAKARIITDERTNSLLVLAARAQLEDIRELVRQLDVEVYGEGRIRVYYLKHSDAEELSQTLNGLLSGQPRSASPGRTGAAGANPQAIRSQITEFASGVTLTADPATNSLVIQASKEAYETLVEVIEQLDIPRPQVLVEGLIMEVDITDSQTIGVDATVRVASGDSDFIFNTGGAIAEAFASGGSSSAALGIASGMLNLDENGRATEDGTQINAIITATASDSRFNVLSAPHILTSDNEEAEIKIGDNIPIVTSRVQSAAGVETGLSTSQNIERQDVGVTLRVTPQISEGDTLRLKIFQEITEVNEELTETTGSATESGVAIRKRNVENTVVVNNGETVVIGGLISEVTDNTVTKVPFLGDIPFFGFFFRTDADKLRKVNLLVFLTPHIVRNSEDLISETIRKRTELLESTTDSAEELQAVMDDPDHAAHAELAKHAQRYPIKRMDEIELARARTRAAREGALAAAQGQRSYEVVADLYRDEQSATLAFTRLLDAGFESLLVSSEADDGALVYELRVGPYDTIERAERVANMLGEAYGHNPFVVVLRPPPVAEGDAFAPPPGSTP